MSPWVLRTRDGNYRKRLTAPSAKTPEKTWSLDEPAPTISATGIGGCFISGYWLESIADERRADMDRASGGASDEGSKPKAVRQRTLLR